MWANARSGLPIPATIDATRTDLRRRFERDPLARHDAELQAVVAALRGNGRLPRYCLLSVGPGQGWRIASMSRSRGAPPDWISEHVFTDRDEAERWAFARRWDLVTGVTALDDVPPGAVAGAPLPATKRLLGYCDPLSVAPGESLTFHVSGDPALGSYALDVVRMWCGDPRPDGPPLRVEPVTTGVEGSYSVARHPTAPGSYGLVPGVGAVLDGLESMADGLVVRAIVAPSGRRAEPQTLVAVGDPWSGTGFSLHLDEQLRPAVAVGDGKRPAVATGDGPLPPGAWAVVTATIDGPTGGITVDAVDLTGGELSHGTATGDGPLSLDNCAELPLTLAAQVGADGTRRHHLAGKLEAPSLRSGDTVLAAWDLAPQETDSWSFVDTGPSGLHGTLHNLPRRGVRGSAWSGTADDWQEARAEFAAVHTYPDALEDCGWPVAFSFVVPDLPSGCYAARLHSGDEVEWIPFFVRPPRGTRTADVALLVPTATYAAYANSRFWWEDPIQEMAQDRLVELGPEEQVLVTMPELAPSCYDNYGDGTAVTYSSRRRPNLFLRPGHGRAELYSCDLYLVDWLRHEGIDVDVITDEDLHHEGDALLDGYTVVVTAQHPEYVSIPMYDALAAFVDAGGRLAYLGGNGITSNIAFSATRPWIMEDRSTLQKHGDPGAGRFEAMQTVDGRYGGQLRVVGRAPGSLVGVDTVTMGFDRAYPIARTEAADDRALTWVFEGIPGRFIGGRGLLGGGAIGQEWDNTRYTAGDPRLVVLGSTIDTSLIPAVLGAERPYHGDVVLFARGDGVVFSVGSMSWCGALPIDDYDNDVARMTSNVLRQFMSPAEVPLPESVRAAARGVAP